MVCQNLLLRVVIYICTSVVSQLDLVTGPAFSQVVIASEHISTTWNLSYLKHRKSYKQILRSRRILPCPCPIVMVPSSLVLEDSILCEICFTQLQAFTMCNIWTNHFKCSLESNRLLKNQIQTFAQGKLHPKVPVFLSCPRRDQKNKWHFNGTHLKELEWF